MLLKFAGHPLSQKKGRKRGGEGRKNDSISASDSCYIEEKKRPMKKYVLVMWKDSKRYHFGISEKILLHPCLIG